MQPVTSSARTSTRVLSVAGLSGLLALCVLAATARPEPNRELAPVPGTEVNLELYLAGKHVRVAAPVAEHVWLETPSGKIPARAEPGVGVYTFERVPVGTAELLVRSPDFEPFSRSIEVTSDAARMRFEVVGSGRLIVDVTEAASGARLEVDSAWLHLVAAPWFPRVEGRRAFMLSSFDLRAHGSVIDVPLPTGDYVLETTVNGLASTFREFSVLGDNAGPTRLDLQLVIGGCIAGLAERTSRHGPAEVQLFRAGDENVAAERRHKLDSSQLGWDRRQCYVEVDENGRFCIPAVEPGSYVLRLRNVWSPYAFVDSGVVEVTSCQTTLVNLKL